MEEYMESGVNFSVYGRKETVDLAVPSFVFKSVLEAYDEKAPEVFASADETTKVPVGEPSSTDIRYVPVTRDSLVYLMVKDLVKDHLVAPASAEFPRILWNGEEIRMSKAVGLNRWRVISHVDSQNAYGAVLRTEFLAIVERRREDRFVLLYLRLGDQEIGDPDN